jgi:integrase
VDRLAFIADLLRAGLLPAAAADMLAEARRGMTKRTLDTVGAGSAYSGSLPFGEPGGAVMGGNGERPRLRLTGSWDAVEPGDDGRQVASGPAYGGRQVAAKPVYGGSLGVGKPHDGARPLAAPLDDLDPEAVRILDAIIDRLAFRVGGETLRFPSRTSDGGRTTEVRDSPEAAAEPLAPEAPDAPEERFGPGIEQMLAEFVAVRTGERGDATHIDKTCTEVRRAARVLGWVTPTDAEPGQIRLYLASLKGRDGGLASISWRNNVRGYLSAFFGYCVQAGKLDANPVAHIPCLQHSKRESKIGSAMEPQVRQLCAATRSRKGGADAAAWYWHFFRTGIRPEGSQELVASDYRLREAHPHIVVPAHADKEARGYRVEIVCPELLDMLRARLAGLPPTGRVWPCPPDSAQFIADWKSAGLPRVGPDGKRITRYSIRHGTATEMINGGVPPELAARQMGHSGASMTRYYVDSAQLQVRKELEKALKKVTHNADEGACIPGRPEVTSERPNGELPMAQDRGVFGGVPGKPPRPTPEVQILRLAAEGQTGTPTPQDNSTPTPTGLSGHSSLADGNPRGGCAAALTGADRALVLALLDDWRRILALAERVLGGAQ